MDDACAIVVQFFDKQLDLQKFEKHFFNIGNQAHFDTKYFEYRVKLWRVLMLIHLILFYAITISAIDILLFTKDNPSFTKNTHILLTIFFTIASIFFNIVLYKMVYSAISNKNNFLQLSKGNPIFSFGHNEDNIQTYNKDDVKEVVVYESRGARNPNLIAVYEICFKDGSAIKFPIC